jgi:hypothetical protein
MAGFMAARFFLSMSGHTGHVLPLPAPSRRFLILLHDVEGDPDPRRKEFDV